MRKILISLLVVGAVGAAAFAASTAFFSDTETSTGNILQAGALDLKIDNTCYYNGQACVLTETNEGEGYFWGGIVKDGNECSCTWRAKDLAAGDVFFDLRDLKPGDWEEDTISLDVDNDAWVCADIKTTANDDSSSTEPELEDGDVEEDPTNDFDGELADELFFWFWYDDGDNVFEEHEVNGVINRGLAKEVLGDAQWAIADSQTGQGPITGGKTVYIGKFFCYGDITPDPVPDNEGVDPTDDSGFDCDGTEVNNVSQTDLLMGDIVFEATQARHQEEFLCNPIKPTE